MNESVKFIFKTLIKVPIIILVSYAIFNLFAFTFTYFRLMGFSYVALQTAVENNYIPTDERNTLQNYLDSLQSGVVDNLVVVCDTNIANDTNGKPDMSMGDNNRVQYGTPITILVSANYNFIFPLVGQNKDKPVELQYNENKSNNIVIKYTVPGLKYYSDLS